MVPTEAQEQEALFRWAAYAAGKWPQLRLLFHVPNGGTRHPAEAAHMKAQGVKPGVPDICLPVPVGRFAALYIELKRKKGGRVSEDQRGWIEALNRAGNRAVVCRGWDEAREEIVRYLGFKEQR
jgi:hypothetical protein